jgi:hypothetical protein
MRNSPSIVPDPEEHKSTWVLDDFGGRLGRAWRRSTRSAPIAIVITDLMTGQYSNPVGGPDIGAAALDQRF